MYVYTHTHVYIYEYIFIFMYQLKKEERVRNMVNKELPKLRITLRAAVEEYESSVGLNLKVCTQHISIHVCMCILAFMYIHTRTHTQYESSDGLNFKVCSKHIYHYMYVRSVYIYICMYEYVCGCMCMCGIVRILTWFEFKGVYETHISLHACAQCNHYMHVRSAYIYLYIYMNMRMCGSVRIFWWFEFKGV